jgi:acyl dehydratase
MGEKATATLPVTQSDVLAWHRQVGATSRNYSNPKSRSFGVHATYPLKAAWASMMQVGMDPAADIDFLKVVHSGQSMRLGVPVRIGDTLSATSQMSRIEDQQYGREATIATAVTNQSGEIVAEYETKFLSRVPRPKAETVFAAPTETNLSPTAPQMALRPLEVYRREKFSLKREDITGYALDAQWLHKDDRFARRVGFKGGIIAQGWRILHGVAHSIIEGYLKNDASRFNRLRRRHGGHGPVAPGEELTLEVDRIGIRGDREVLSFRLVPDGGGNPKASGTIELRGLPAYAAVFPGNASQSPGMAKDLYLAGGVGRQTLIEATSALGEDGNLLLDVITGGASLPEGDEARKAAHDKAIAEAG